MPLQFGKLSDKDRGLFVNFNFSRPIYKFRSLYPERMVADVKEFYLDLQRDYFNQMIFYLRSEIGLKIDKKVGTPQ